MSDDIQRNIDNILARCLSPAVIALRLLDQETASNYILHVTTSCDAHWPKVIFP